MEMSPTPKHAKEMEVSKKCNVVSIRHNQEG